MILGRVLVGIWGRIVPDDNPVGRWGILGAGRVEEDARVIVPDVNAVLLSLPCSMSTGAETDVIKLGRG